MVAGLLGAELADRWKDTESITSQHDDVVGVRVDDTRNPGTGNEVDGVSATSVLSDADVIVVGHTRRGVVDDILEDGSEADSPEDIGLLLSGKVDALGVASTLDVKDTGIRPNVLVVTNKESAGVGRKCGLASSGETEEESDSAVYADIGGGVKGELTKLDWLEVVLV